MLFSVLISTAQVPQHNFHTPRSRPGWEEGVPEGTGYPAPSHMPGTQSGSSCQRPGLAEEARSQLAAPSGPGPQTCRATTAEEPGAQDPIGLRLLTSPSGGWSQRWPLPLGHRGGNWGEGHRHLRAWTRSLGSLGEGSELLQDTAPGLFPGPPAHPLREAGMRLSPHSLSEAHHSDDLWLNVPLTVAHWQLLAWGRSLLQHRPMAERPLILWGNHWLVMGWEATVHAATAVLRLRKAYYHVIA